MTGAPDQLRLSVAMTTFNGARFIREQLDSLAAQTRRPDELVIGDDGSTDQTTAIIQQFSREAPFPVRLHVNQRNLGVRGNFQKVIELAAGDIIFLCDQDDIWRPSKLERFERAFAQSPDLALAFCDARVVDEQARPLGYTFWRRLGFDARQQALFDQDRAFVVFLKHCFVAGATLAFRSALRPLILPLDQRWLYDAWIATVISAVGQVRIIPEPLNDYRQHAAQVIGGQKKGLWQTYREARQNVDRAYFQAMAGQFERLRDHLVGAARIPPDDPRILAIDGKIALCRNRARLRQNPLLRWPRVAAELLSGHYHLYAHGWRTAALDLFV